MAVGQAFGLSHDSSLKFSSVGWSLILAGPTVALLAVFLSTDCLSELFFFFVSTYVNLISLFSCDIVLDRKPLHELNIFAS